GAAPASVAARVMSATPLEVGWPDSLVREDPREVSPLARGGMSPVGGLTSYPPRYRAALACSLILYPLPRGPLLRGAVPTALACATGRTTGLPRSADVAGWGRSRLYAGGSTSAPDEFGASGPGHVPFGSSVTAACACSCVTTPATLHLG